MLKQFFDAHDDGVEFSVDCDEVYTTAGDGYWSNAVKDVRVTAMGMFIGLVDEWADDEDETEECYSDSDFAVHYDTATWNDDVDGLIYTDSAFLANVQDKMRDVLLQMGVDDATANELAGDISYSEQGMQDEGRVSCDAYALADFLRKFYKERNTVLN
jgi:hypothetical protein